MIKSVFISHSSKDKRIANELSVRLEAEGIGCWIAPRDVDPRFGYGEEIVKNIEKCLICLLVLSENSNRSDAVTKEIERAFNYKKLIVPLRIQEVNPSKQIEFFVAGAQWVDVFGSPLSDRIEYLSAVVHSVEMKTQLPLPAPQRKSVAARIEYTLEKILRYKLASATGAVTLLVGIAVAGLAMQHITQTVVQNAATEINKSALTVTKAGQQLIGVNDRLGTIETDVKDAKKETSADPREELANIGVSWDMGNFENAVYHNDIRSVKLFLAGGMPWYGLWAESAALNNYGEVLSALQARMDLEEKPVSCSFELHIFQDYYDGNLLNIISSNIVVAPITLTADSVLSPTQEKYLKFMCKNPNDITEINTNINEKKSLYLNEKKRLLQIRDHGKDSVAKCFKDYDVKNSYTIFGPTPLTNQLTDYCNSQGSTNDSELKYYQQQYYFWKLAYSAVAK